MSQCLLNRLSPVYSLIQLFVFPQSECQQPFDMQCDSLDSNVHECMANISLSHLLLGTLAAELACKTPHLTLTLQLRNATHSSFTNLSFTARAESCVNACLIIMFASDICLRQLLLIADTQNKSHGSLPSAPYFQIQPLQVEGATI